MNSLNYTYIIAKYSSMNSFIINSLGAHVNWDPRVYISNYAVKTIKSLKN